MPITRALIFQNVTIANADGASQVTYELPETESVTITAEPVTDTVGAGRTLAAYFNVSMSAKVLNTNIFNDGRIYGANTAAEPVNARMILRGVSGTININAGPTLLSATPLYDGNRKGFQISFSEYVTNVEAFLSESNV